MTQDLAEKLRRKGWPEEEIEKTVRILQSDQAEKKQFMFKKSMSPIIYWSALILTLVGNLIISVVMVPFLVILQGIELFFTIGLLGAAFGLLFNLIINDIENMDTEHHIVAGVFIPAIAIINVFIIVRLSNVVSGILQQTTKQSAIIIAFIYVSAFMLPYLIGKTREAMRDKREKERKNEEYYYQNTNYQNN